MNILPAVSLAQRMRSMIAPYTRAKGLVAMRTTRRSATLLAAACAALLCAGQCAAAVGPGYGYAEPQPESSRSPATSALLRDDPDGLTLQPGEFAWAEGAQARSDAPVSMLVNLRDQRGYLYRDGQRIAVTTVSTGKPGHDTPTGVFPIMSKEKMHHSSKYDNAPMPWMQRLTEWGHALHAGHVMAGPASHGCVRLPAEFARQLYLLTRPGDIVVISQDDSLLSLARAGVDSQVALSIGVVDPLPRVIRVAAPDDEAARGVAAETAAAAGVTAF
jgi:lipoprotein-anchoring transpeptidase ErfK/SrfK